MAPQRGGPEAPVRDQPSATAHRANGPARRRGCKRARRPSAPPPRRRVGQWFEGGTMLLGPQGEVYIPLPFWTWERR